MRSASWSARLNIHDLLRAGVVCERSRHARAARSRCAPSALLVLDVDGVLTDGSLLVRPARRSAQALPCARRPRHQAAAGRRRAGGRDLGPTVRRPSARAAANSASATCIQGVDDKTEALDEAAAQARRHRHAGGLRGRRHAGHAAVRARRLRRGVRDAHPLARRAAHRTTRCPAATARCAKSATGCWRRGGCAHADATHEDVVASAGLTWPGDRRSIAGAYFVGRGGARSTMRLGRGRRVAAPDPGYAARRRGGHRNRRRRAGAVPAQGASVDAPAARNAGVIDLEYLEMDYHPGAQAPFRAKARHRGTATKSGI